MSSSDDPKADPAGSFETEAVPSEPFGESNGSAPTRESNSGKRSGEIAPSALVSMALAVAEVEQSRIKSEERIALATIEADERQGARWHELEVYRLQHEHTRDLWAVRFGFVAVGVETSILVGGILLHIYGHAAIGNLLLGFGGGGIAGAGIHAWHTAERERRERNRPKPETRPSSAPDDSSEA